MKNKIDVLLAKHFQGKTSPEEEAIVIKYKKEYPSAYLNFKHLWHSNTKIDVVDFDSRSAWFKVKTQSRHNKARFLFSYKQVAAVAVLLLLGSLFAFFITQRIVTPIVVERSTISDERDSILLADGTTVWLNQNSKLIYPEKFKGKTRRVKLEGEAWFEVTENRKKPFKVETNYSTVTVLGTTFNIDTDSLATAVYLASGKVNIQSTTTGTSFNLLPNNKAVANSTGLTKSQITNPNYLSWKTGVFKFEDTPLESVLNDLNNYYNKPIKTTKEISDLLFTAEFEHTSQKDILEILQLTFNLEILENSTFYEIR